MSVPIKICGLLRIEDARAVNAAMPDYAGFIFYEKSRRYVEPVLAKKIRAVLDNRIRTVGVFVEAPIERIAQVFNEGIISAAQLHGGEDNAYITRLREALPTIEIWQAFKVRTADDLRKVTESAADLVLLDGGAGEGKLFNWELASRFPRPFILAGGLTPENIPDAIRKLRPFAVDLSTGVETDGKKDAAKIRAAVRAAREADA
ncbi:MAG: phosphoribosylanthranilate isomerase [Clostridiales bacterium]|nr:phosphoribosylanthranilate isomerase [Clostridiales bacterium]